MIKKRFICSTLIFVLFVLLSNTAAFAGRAVKVLKKTGSLVKGELVSENENQLVVKYEGFEITIKKEDIDQVVDIEYAKTGSIGVGFGIPYGIVGLNLDYSILENLSISAGFGTTVIAGSAFNIGLKYFLRDVGATWRPRIAAYYGTNSAVDYVFQGSSRKFNGLTVGLGQLWSFGETKSHGLDLDLMLILTNGEFDEIAERYGEDGGGKVKLAIGYRYNF